jgi:hypothetical protein
MTPTTPNRKTRAAERKEAATAAGADRLPSAAEEAAAEAVGDLEPSVAEHERDMAERGAHQQGEGRI